jgi:histidinol-phosphatase (PHP family)
MTARPPLGSYHNHLGYCDGAGTAVEYAESALAAGLHSLGLSCHMPVPFPSDWNMPAERLATYCAEVRAASAAYRGRLPIYLGLELEHLSPDVAAGGEALARQYAHSAGLDFAVVSMHYVGRLAPGQPHAGQPWAIDSSADQFAHQLGAVYAGDARRLIEDYWQRVAQMAGWAGALGLPVIAGHIDKAKMWNIGGRYFSETAPWYLEAADTALRAIAAAGLVVEINAAGLVRPHGEPYPGPRLLRRCRELGIPATVSADAHRPADVARGFDQAAAILRAAGYHRLALLDGGRWIEAPLA